MQLQDGQRILFIGDSITDCGRDRDPHAWHASLGDGYVSQVEPLLGAHYPGRNFKLFNLGISGNRVTDLVARWERDVVAYAPDWLTIMIGINDVWRQFDHAHFMEQVTLEIFSAELEKLVVRSLPQVQGLVLMTPFYLETNRDDPMRAMMDSYGNSVRCIAAKHGCIFVDTQAAFDAYLEKRPTQTLCGDRVHPSATGHAILAKAWLNAVGFEWQGGGGSRRALP